MSVTAKLNDIALNVRSRFTSAILSLSYSSSRRFLLHFVRFDDGLDPSAETRFVVEDAAGSVVIEWEKSQLQLSTTAVSVPDSGANGSAFDVILPSAKLDDLVLNASTRHDVTRVVQESKDWHYLKSCGLSPAGCVLFCGPVGCGKATTAEAIATELGVRLVRFSFDRLAAILAEGNPATIRRMIEYLGASRSVVLVDNVVPEREGFDERVLRDFRSAIDALLPLFDSIVGRSLIIVSTISEEVLHASLWQRFDEVVRFNAPGRQEISNALAKWLDPLTYTEPQLQNLLEMADELSFSTVERLCLDVKRSCALRGDSTIQDNDLTGARERQKSRTRSFNFSSIKLAPSADRSAPYSVTIDR